MRAEMQSVLREVEKAIVGKTAVIEKILLVLLAEGHVLLDDVPGVGKTTLALALGRAIGLRCRRVQFTPDVLPSDIVGFSTVDRETGSLRYQPGVVNDANLLLGDEINRTSSKTQSALLEAMEERQVTVDGQTYPLPRPFAVIATQNHVGAAGTQLLPYAQLDRFMAQLTVGYPDREAQVALLRDRQTGNPLDHVECALSRDDFLRIQDEIKLITVKDAILDYIARLAMASRDDPRIEVGISPRGALFLNRMAKARAWSEGRDYVTGGDVQTVFHDVCAHRVLLSRRGRMENAAVPAVLNDLLTTVPVPDWGV
ncbi:MAG: MoxR family ATPase [Clostridia bacterium]|nr:MoxR family ATPase [Clostridia bacterium]